MASRGGGIRRRACMPPAPRLPCLGTSAGQRKREPVTGYPSPEPPAERLAKTWERERARFLADYNDRLLNGLTMLSIAAILAFRFVIKLQLGETIGWAAFLFLQARFMRKFFFFRRCWEDACWGSWGDGEESSRGPGAQWVEQGVGPDEAAHDGVGNLALQCALAACLSDLAQPNSLASLFHRCTPRCS